MMSLFPSQAESGKDKNVLKLSEDVYSTAYGLLCKPGLQGLLRLLKLDVSYVRARGEFLYRIDDQGKTVEVVDMLGGYGSTLLGHNAPELKSALIEALNADTAVHAQASIRSQAAVVAERLRFLLDQESVESLESGESGSAAKKKYFVHLLSTGTEAVEAALKHALLRWSNRRELMVLAIQRLKARSPESAALVAAENVLTQMKPVVIALKGSFHGKTAGSLSLTSNQAYSHMYPGRAVETVYLDRNANVEEMKSLFQSKKISLSPESGFSSIAAVIVEPIQGEGGIQVLEAAFVQMLAQICREHSIAFISDEIQTGLYRTGKLAAIHHMGVDPDYITLGKSLGGGLAKVSALLVREDHYQDEFGINHSSTFAEDDLSSIVAAKTLEILDANRLSISDRAARFEVKVKGFVGELQGKYPGVIGAVRGKGFLIGIEFDPLCNGLASHALDALGQSGYLTYIFASYLLNRHGVRVAATLNDSNTIRLEPSAFIEDTSIEKALCAIEILVEHIFRGRIHEITRHLFSENHDKDVSNVVSTPKTYSRLKTSSPRRVTFVAHLIDPGHVADFDPMFAAMSEAEREKFLDQFGPLGKSVISHQQEIHGANGERVLFEIQGITASSSYFESAIKTGDGDALQKVREAVAIAQARGARHIGLGQYTSIVTDNGLLVPTADSAVTTGNSLTVGLSLKALKKLLKKRGQSLGDLHVGIVGAAGNICNVYAQIIGDYVREMTLVHRESFEQSPKFQAAVREILWNSKMDASQIHKTSDLSALINCDAVVLGTNSTRQMLLPEHLKQNALVLDISVPSNVHPRVFKERPDVECVQGGYAKLPLGQRFENPLFPMPEGEVFACMAETLTLGLLNFPESFSRGPLSKERILRIVRMAREVGIDLGSIKRMGRERR